MSYVVCVDIEIDLVVWMVDIDSIPVWGMGIGLISVQGSEFT